MKTIEEERYQINKEECFHCGRWSNMVKTGICRYCHTKNSLVKKFSAFRPVSLQKLDTPLIKKEALVGSQKPQAKLTEEQVKEIRKSYIKGKITYRELSEKYKVSHALIGYIIQRKWWKHI